jgi:rifampicin phosphotransferase
MFSIDLRSISRKDIGLAGGKGANLGDLIRAGFPVPAGFVVTTDAYDEFVKQNDLEAAIATAIQEGSAASQRVQAAFAAARMPIAVSQAIRAQYQKLGLPPVAVRSSATAEDLPDAAFAGQQDTYLNIVGIDDVLDRVQDCWASLWNERAMAYREQQAADQSEVKLAVVVQEMVRPDTAGVLFTANPITGIREEIVVDSNPGLGEAVVSGATTPDHFVLAHGRLGWRVTERVMGHREHVVRASEEGGTETATAPDDDSSAAISDRDLRRLAHLAHQVELHFGVPQDIEWAWANEQFFILQARPITALPEPRLRPGRLQELTLHQLGERFQIRPYPLDLTTWAEAIWSSAVAPMLTLIGLRTRALDELFVVEDGVAIGMSGQMSFQPTPWIVLAPVRLALQARLFEPSTWESDPDLQSALARARGLRDRDLRDASWSQLMDLLDQALDLPMDLAGETRRRYFPRAALAAGALRLWLGLLRKGDRFGSLLTGAPTRTLAANQALEELATAIREAPELEELFTGGATDHLRERIAESLAGQALLERLDAFLREYGHREQYVAGASQPTWADSPGTVFGILAGLARSAPRPPSDSNSEQWEEARDEVLAHPLMARPAVQERFLAVLETARWLFRIREDSHFYATLPLPTVRAISLELGRRLTEVGALDSPYDVFHLVRADLDRCGGGWPPPSGLINDLRAAAERRKERRANLEATPFIDLTVLAPRDDETSGDLRGSPGSPGIASGPVRIIRGEAEFSLLQPGEVLVAPFTNPAWTPLFRRAIAVVADVGGPASHAAIVAREYGIPAVMATINGTTVLRDGQRVRVDGFHGTVSLEQDPNTSESSEGEPT